MTVLRSADDIDLDWLTGVMRDAGAIAADERVGAVRTEASDSSWAHLVRLRAEVGGRTVRLLLKVCRGFGPSEVHYLARDYVDLPDAPLPACLHAAWEDGGYHVLMEDLSATHGPCWERPVTRARWAATAEALAALHAWGWGAEGLARLHEVPPDEAAVERFVAHHRPGVARLVAAAGLPGRWAERLRRIVEGWTVPPVEALTVLHGDPNPGNVLVPLDAEGPVVLIDRQPFDWSLRVGLGASDLASVMVTYADPADRRRLEWDVLRHYQQALAARGVEIGWDELATGYRRCAWQALLSAVEWCSEPDDVERMRWVWERQLASGIAAFEELDGASLL